MTILDLDYNVIYREKDGGMQVIISYKDSCGKWKQKSKQGFKTDKKGDKAAKNWANDAIADLKTNGNTYTDRLYSNITFKEYYDLFISDRRTVLREQTLTSYNVVIKKFEGLYNLKLKDIKTMDIQREFNNFNNLNSYTLTTLETYLKRLKCLFNFAINKYEIINKSPVKNIEFTGNKSVEKKALNAHELLTLLKHLKQLRATSYYIASLLASKCGLRIGEICGLTWLDVDFKNKNLTVRQQWKKNKEGKWGVGELKSENSYREVPIPPIVIEALLELKTSHSIDISAKILKIKNTNSFSGSLSHIYKKVGFDISIHELRHTYATNLIANGIDFKTSAKLLGHDVSETMKTYAHVNSDMFNNAKTIIDKIF